MGFITEWTDLQFINYSVSEEFEDGSIGAWQLEDWEIYGPGAGGYTSSGPFGDWQSDILAWLNGGSMLARDIIDWDAMHLQSHNISSTTQEAARVSPTTYYLNGTSYLPYDPSPTFGLVGAAAYAEGDIVVTAARSHADQSVSCRFATVDPLTHQPATWMENITFLDMARANADANIIRFDLGEGEPPLTPEEKISLITIRAVLQETISALHELGRDSYFQVDGRGRIRVGELISLSLSDWHLYSSSAFTDNRIGDVLRNDGNPELRMNRSWMGYLAKTPNRLIFHFLHEMSHATRIGWQHRSDANDELVANDIAAAVMQRIGSSIPQHLTASTGINYHSSVPTT